MKRKYHTVIRGGGGIFYDRVDAALTLQALRFDGIHRQQFIIHDPSFFPQEPTVADLIAQNVPQTLRSIDRSIQSPYNIVSSIGVERDLPVRLKIASTFTHTRSVHLLLSRNIMAPPPSSSTNGGTSPNLYQYESAGVLDGNQIITNVSRTFSGRLGVYGYYAYGRIFSNTDGPGTFPSNQFDLRQEYGRAATDIRIVLCGEGLSRVREATCSARSWWEGPGRPSTLRLDETHTTTACLPKGPRWL